MTVDTPAGAGLGDPGRFSRVAAGGPETLGRRYSEAVLVSNEGQLSVGRQLDTGAHEEGHTRRRSAAFLGSVERPHPLGPLGLSW